MLRTVALLRSGREYSRGRLYAAVHHSATANSFRSIAKGRSRSPVGMLTKLNFGEFRSSNFENLGSKLRMPTRRYWAFPEYRTVRFKVLKRERSMPWLAIPVDSMYANPQP